MISLAVNGYTERQIKRALHYVEARRVSFRYELLDGNDISKCEALYVEPGSSITLQSDNSIKRTGRFVIRDDGNINIQTDKIKPYFRLAMPGGGLCEWPLGVFYIPTPTESRRAGSKWLEIEAYDKSMILQTDSDSARTYFAEGTKYVDAVSSLLQSAGINRAIITKSEYTLAVAREWDLGTPKSEIIAMLLKEINYNDLYVNENGVFIVEPYIQPSLRTADYTYKADEFSIIPEDGCSRSVDLFNAPNVIIGIVSNPDVEEIKYVYEITDPANPISISARNGRRVVDKHEFEGIASQAELQAATLKYAAEVTEVYETVSIDTALMPHHGYNDLLILDNSMAFGRYLETSWTMTLKAEERMSHTVRKLIV